MSARFELLSQMTMIVDFAVEDNPTRMVFVAEWLSASCQVDDGKSPMTERGLPIGKNTATVRASVPQPIGHRTDGLAHFVAQGT
jgi:hypothetical protein